MNKPFIALKVLRNTGKGNELVRKIGSRKRRRIFHFIQADKFSGCTFYVKVDYGKGFINEGEYTTKKDLLFALSAFLERDLIKDFG